MSEILKDVAIATSAAAVGVSGTIGAISAIGFKAAGIKAGSLAAGWMSSVAISSGSGGIAAGSTVSILQGVGAGGLGLISLPIAVGCGALGYGSYKMYKHLMTPNL